MTESPDWVAVGRTIGERRRALGLPKNEAARRASVSNTTWRLLEAGANQNPTDETLVRVARVVELDPETLLRAAGRPVTRTAAGDPPGGDPPSGDPPPALADGTSPPAVRHEPASLPLSYPRDRLTPYFMDRREVIAEIAAYLERWDEPVKALVLTGQPGSGKTMVAAKYMEKHQRSYDKLWWVDASTRDRSARHRDLRALAAELGVEPGDEQGDPGELAHRVAQAMLADGRRWLLVIDGVDRGAMAEEFLRETGSVRVLLTSRQGADWRRAVPLPIDPLPPRDAAEFLRRRTGSFRRQQSGDEDAAESLAAELGHLPRALDRAGAYVDETGISLKSFLDLSSRMSARDRLLDLLDESVAGNASGPHAWLPDLRRTSPPVLDLLRILAFLAPQPLDPGHLTQREARLPASLRSLAQEGSIGLSIAQGLRRTSLVAVGDGLRMHPIAQAAVRRSLRPQERRAWAAAALELLLSVFPLSSGGAEEQDRCRSLLPHVRAATGYGQLHGGRPAAVAQLLVRMAEHLRLEGDLVAAKRDADRAVELLLADGQAPGPVVVAARLTLALVHVDLGEFELAGIQFRAAREACDADGVELHTVALLDAHLAAIDAQLGDYDSASRRLDEVRAAYLDGREPAPAEAKVAVLSVVALAWQFLDEIEEARHCFGEALTLRRGLTGKRHHGFALDCYGLAGVELRADQPHRAGYWFEMGLGIFRSLYRDDADRSHEVWHPKVGDCLRGLAAVERKAGNLERAVELLDEAEAVYSRVRGFDHHPVRKAAGSTRDLLLAWRRQTTTLTARDREQTARRLRMEPPPLDATRRYSQQKLAIGNHARGFDPAAEAVTALRLGDDLLDLEAFDISLDSFATCVRLAQPYSLLALKGRMRRARALERHEHHEDSREEYRAIVQALAESGRGATSERPSWALRLQAEAERGLRRLDLNAPADPARRKVAAEAGGQR